MLTLHCIIKNIPDMNIDIYIDDKKIFECSMFSNEINFNSQIKEGRHHLKIVSNRKSEIKKVGLKKHNSIRVYKTIYELYFTIFEDSILELSYMLKNFSFINSDVVFGIFSCKRKSKILIIEERVDCCKELFKLGRKTIMYNYLFYILFSLLTVLFCVEDLCCAGVNIRNDRTVVLLIISSIAVFTIPVKIYLEYLDYKKIVTEAIRGR